MLVVVIMAVLAAIALPVFTEESRKAKAESEVAAWLAEIQVKQEQFKMDNPTYRDTAGPCPAAPSAGVTIVCHNAGQDWDGLRIAAPTTTAACTYDIQAGTTAGTVVGGFPAFTSPARNWYYVIAECDEDGNGAPNAQFFVSSMDSTIVKINEGQ